MNALATIHPLPVAPPSNILNERARRQLLRVLGHEAADTLHPDALAEALRQQNQLADDVQELGAAVLLASADPFTAQRVINVIDEESPDEALSTLSAMFDRIVEPYERGIGIAPSGVALTIGGMA